jgi:hypothetical protein
LQEGILRPRQCTDDQKAIRRQDQSPTTTRRLTCLCAFKPGKGYRSSHPHAGKPRDISVRRTSPLGLNQVGQRSNNCCPSDAIPSLKLMLVAAILRGANRNPRSSLFSPPHVARLLIAIHASSWKDALAPTACANLLIPSLTTRE